MALGLVWAAFLTFHELRERTSEVGIEYQFLPTRIEVNLGLGATGVVRTIQPAIIFRNSSPRSIKYQIESITATFDGAMIASEPIFENRGGTVAPGSEGTYFYPTMPAADPFPPSPRGVVEWTLTYGLPNQEPIMRSRRQWAIELERLLGTAPVAYSVRYLTQYEEDTRITRTRRSADTRGIGDTN